MKEDKLGLYMILGSLLVIVVITALLYQYGFELSYSQIPVFATLALPIFLLTPYFYLLVKREVKHLEDISEKLTDTMKSNHLEINLQPSREFSDLVSQFNEYVLKTEDQLHALEEAKNSLRKKNKVLGYKRNRMRSVIESLPHGIIVMDEVGTVVFANDKIIAKLGVTKEDIVNKQVEDWCQNTDVLEYIKRFKRAKSSAYSAHPIHYSPENAPEKTIEVCAYPLFSPTDSNSLFGTLFVFQDITLEMLAKQNRAEFIAHVAHELKTPLNTLSMYSDQLLNNDDTDSSFVNEAVNVIHDETERMINLITNLLNVTKIEMGSITLSKTRVRVKELLDDTCSNLTRSAKDKDVKINVQLPDTLSPLFGDKSLLSICINNFLTNAIKYNKTGGTVEVSASEDDEAITIEFSDTGIGIEDKDINHIFEKFYRSDEENVRQQSGHGLGLALAYHIIVLHRGTVHVESNTGEGTTFSIQIPKDRDVLKESA